MGFEPTIPTWKDGVLPLNTNDTRLLPAFCSSGALKSEALELSPYWGCGTLHYRRVCSRNSLLVTILGIEPRVSTLKGLRVSQFHYMVVLEASKRFELLTIRLTAEGSAAELTGHVGARLITPSLARRPFFTESSQ